MQLDEQPHIKIAIKDGLSKDYKTGDYITICTAEGEYRMRFVRDHHVGDEHAFVIPDRRH